MSQIMEIEREQWAEYLLQLREITANLNRIACALENPKELFGMREALNRIGTNIAVAGGAIGVSQKP